MIMNKKQNEINILEELRQHSGSSEAFLLPFDYLATEGVANMIDLCGCNWLFSDLGADLKFNKKYMDIDTSFLIVRIKKDDKGGCEVSLREDTDEPVIYSKKYSYTDFPLSDFELYLCDNVFLLKNEY